MNSDCRPARARTTPAKRAAAQTISVCLKTALALCLLMSANVQAAFIAVTNPGFEADVLTNAGFQLTVSGWTVTAGGVWNPPTSAFPGEAPEGLNTAFLGTESFGLATGILQQTTGATFQTGLTYLLTVELGDRADLSLPTFRIGLWADGVLVSTGGLVNSPSDPRIPADGQFSTIDALVTADASIDGKAIEIRFEAFLVDPALIIDDASSSVQISLDNVQLQIVPLPAAVYLFGSTLALLGWLRRRPVCLA